MPKIDSGLIFSESSYDIFGNQTIQILDVTDATNKNFHLQLRCMKDKSEKIDFEKLKEYLKNNTKTLLNGKRALYYPGYKPAKMDESARTNELFNLFSGIQHIEYIYNKVLFRQDEKKVEKVNDRNLINFFKITSFQKDEGTIQVGYEIPETNIQDIIPNCCMYFIENGKLTKKTHLSPYSSTSLQNLLTKEAMNKFPANAEELKIIFYEEKLGENDPYFNIYFKLQDVISDTLQHLEKPKFFEKSGADKIAIFKELSKMISNKEPLKNIKVFLNNYDKVETLSKHRGPWGIFTFLKGKTHSVLIWNELREMLPENSNQVTETRLSH